LFLLDYSINYVIRLFIIPSLILYPRFRLWSFFQKTLFTFSFFYFSLILDFSLFTILFSRFILYFFLHSYVLHSYVFLLFNFFLSCFFQKIFPLYFLLDFAFLIAFLSFQKHLLLTLVIIIFSINYFTLFFPTIFSDNFWVWSLSYIMLFYSVSLSTYELSLSFFKIYTLILCYYGLVF
jgi:hypothetical protein